MSISARQNKILVILGPTASGKSALAVKIAKWVMRPRTRTSSVRGRHGKGAEIISADSRQVYRGLDIGTAKVNGKWRVRQGKREFLYQGVPHHLIDFVSPRRQYSPAEFAAAGRKILYTLLASGYTQIICGGTGQYIDAFLGAHPIPDVPPDANLRAKLEKLSTAELFARLKKLDPRRAREIDHHNPRRLVRALEIVLTTGKSVPKIVNANPYSNILQNIGISNVDVLKIGLNPPPDELRRRLDARLQKDLRRGLIAEVKRLHKEGLSWKRLNELGLEYRIIAQYLRDEIPSKEALLQKLRTELWQYTKRQMRWFKRDKNIRWAKNEREALALVNVSLRRK